jgi:hypothetical protein
MGPRRPIAASPSSTLGKDACRPSSSAYFGIASDDACSMFGGMGDDAMHHIINDGLTANDAYTQEEGETRAGHKARSSAS